MFLKQQVKKKMVSLMANEQLLRKVYGSPVCIEPPANTIKLQNQTLPNIIWRTWKDHNWKQECSSAYIQTKKILPDWKQIVWTDEECLHFIENTFDPLILKAYNSLNYGVMRADFWRYLIIYYYGGLYLDMKSCVVALPCFNTLIQSSQANQPILFTSPWKHNRFHTHLFKQGEMQQFWIAAQPRSPALWFTICQVVTNILNLQKNKNAPFLFLPLQDSIKSRILSTTGPLVYTYTLATHLKYNKRSVMILDGNCNDTIAYDPPNIFERTRYRKDHYSKQHKPLIKSSS